jgi:altronate dehydratase small subunit
MVRAIRLHDEDNVATLVDNGNAGDRVNLGADGVEAVTLRAAVAYGHKVALRGISEGESILKYGKVIGKATQSIEEGQHVHVHNVEALRGRGDKK